MERVTKKLELFWENIKDNQILIRTAAVTIPLAVVIGLSGCSSKTESEEKDYARIYITEHSEDDHALVWEGISHEDYREMPQELIVEQSEEDGTLYIVDTFGQGYLAASQYDSKTDAISHNPNYKDDNNFHEGYNKGKQDKYLKQADVERRQYIGIKPEDVKAEEMFYPLETLSVVSYDGLNAIVENYNEDEVNRGVYTDLLGQDITPYIGQDYQVSSLYDFAIKHTEQIADSIYVRPSNYQLIPEITPAEISSINVYAKVNQK